MISKSKKIFWSIFIPTVAIVAIVVSILIGLNIIKV